MEVLRKARLDNNLLEFFPQQVGGRAGCAAAAPSRRTAPAGALPPAAARVAWAGAGCGLASSQGVPSCTSLHRLHAAQPPSPGGDSISTACPPAPSARHPTAPQKRSWQDFESHFEAAGLTDLVAYNAKKLHEAHCQAGRGGLGRNRHIVRTPG